jgi:hypothetical protein
MKKYHRLYSKIIIWWKTDLSKIFFVTLVGIFLYIVTNLPYLNIVLLPGVTLLLWWLVCVYLWKITYKISLILILIGFGLTGIGQIFYRKELADNSANFGYYLSVFVFIQRLISLKNEKK